jgi:hypothetical protein
MDRSIENLALYRRLLAEPNVANDQVRHLVLLQLLADEEARMRSLALLRHLIVGPNPKAGE